MAKHSMPILGLYIHKCVNDQEDAKAAEEEEEECVEEDSHFSLTIHFLKASSIWTVDVNELGATDPIHFMSCILATRRFGLWIIWL